MTPTFFIQKVDADKKNWQEKISRATNAYEAGVDSANSSLPNTQRSLINLGRL